MKKSTIEKIEKEIDEKTKMPENIKNNIRKEIFTNIVVASIIILYFIFILLGSVGSIKNVRTIDLNIFSMIFLGIAIVLFEVAYRKDEGSLAIYGIESLVVAIFTLFLPYIIFELDEKHKKYYLLASIYIAAYYILKSIYIATRTRTKYMNSISDIKEIVKKEKSKRIIKEELEEIKENKESISKKNTTKKRGIPKKQNLDKVIKENEEEKTMPKKRGRPKKAETKSSEDEQKEPETPKKRGRPRKVVASND